MADEADEEWYGEGELAPRRGRRRRAPLILTLVAVLMVAAVGVAAYFWFNTVWINADKPFEAASHETAGSGETSPADKPVLTDLLATQEKTSADLEALNQSVVAQQAQLKAISDQLSALSSRVDALQSAAAAPPPTPAPPPTLAPPPTEAPPPAPPNARAQAVPKPARRPSHAPRPAGPVSVGGAPLGAPSNARGH
jgi:uncharacterized coiled-coil protein SlyX